MTEQKDQTNVNQDLIDLIEKAFNTLDDLSEATEKDVEIDEFDIDGEAIRTPKLHQKYLSRLSHESITLVKMQQLQKRIYMERWKYYNGKQTDKYMATHGILNDKIIKGDIDKYLAADKRLGYANELLAVQKEIVNFLEKTVKDISNRGFHIKSVIDWRRFESGL